MRGQLGAQDAVELSVAILLDDVARVRGARSNVATSGESGSARTRM